MPQGETAGIKNSMEKVITKNDSSETKQYTQGVYESLEARKARTGEGSRTKKTRIQKGY